MSPQAQTHEQHMAAYHAAFMENAEALKASFERTSRMIADFNRKMELEAKR